MTFVDRLFRPFERLHGAEEFSGIGVGLATVQRAIERQGGRVWIEGAVNEGATAYFTLAKRHGNQSVTLPHDEAAGSE